MNGEEKVNSGTPVESSAAEALSPSAHVCSEELAESAERLREEVESRKYEEAELELEFVSLTREQLEGLSDEELRAQVELLQEQIQHSERQKELDRKALNLGLLKLANRAPRCSHLKSNGKPCRAPAMGGHLFCVFHLRALESHDGPRMKVEVLENRESLQLAVKQIMERIVNGRIEERDASLLLRAVQVANSTLKAGRVRAVRRKPARSESRNPWANAVENSG